jgi:hypothetical protein
MNVQCLELDEFVRSIGVDKRAPYSIFLGAGASISSGVPSATTCTWRWKQSIFCTRNPGLEDKVGELSLPSVQQRIANWLEANGILPPPDEEEYGYFIEKCLPIRDNRRQFFAELTRRARPYVGYKVLCLLAEEELVKTVWTTNFDGLVARAAADFSLTPVEISIESRQRAFRQPLRGELVCVSLHGDYRYDSLKNTKDEVKEQDKRLRGSLCDTLQSHSLIVLGYSGRDASVMEALTAGLSKSGPHGKVFWCGFGDQPCMAVENLLGAAKQAGREAYFVRGAAFDDTMIRLGLHCLEDERLRKAKALIGSAAEAERPPRASFQSGSAKPTSIIKSNAWVVRCPAEMFQFQLTEWPAEKVWKWLADVTDGHDVVAVPFKHVLAFGTVDGIRNAFGNRIDGEIKRVPITEVDTRYEDGAIICLLRRALVRAIAGKRGIATDGDGMIWELAQFTRETEGTKDFAVHHAARLALRRINQEMYLTVDPTVHCDGDALTDREAMRALTIRILGYQHNHEFNTDLNRWRELLLEKPGATDFDFPVGSAAFQFSVVSEPAFAEVSQPKRRPIQIPTNVKRLIRHSGIEVIEPRLSFGQNGRETADTLPLRGLATKGPFDRVLSGTVLDDTISLGVVCPRAESRMLEAFLDEAGCKHSPERGDREEYIVQYPGFKEAFRTTLLMPKPNDNDWQTLPEIRSDACDEEGCRLFFQGVRDAVATLAATGRRLVLILTPDRWNRYRRFESPARLFDVHDQVKAYCVKQGIATQFLDQETLRYRDKCRIWWWLSVALYAKSMRTPWVLDGLDPGSAFVGLGYKINRHAPSGKHIVLGCSHLYNAQGQGLQFRLSRIEDPIVSRGNPFMSFEDARRVGDTIRTLFWDAKLRLPDRVVIHKLTPFRSDEQKGLRAGLEGVNELELIEINHEPSLRYISSQVDGSRFMDSKFPVRRGTALRLSDHEALLWVHGATESVKPSWTYFQGKRRIPAPVVLRRYAGRSDLATLSTELLGLSKMDWNSADLYSKLPATVLSSKQIAGIGALLDRFGESSYDYRLFM